MKAKKMIALAALIVTVCTVTCILVWGPILLLIYTALGL